MISAFQEHLTVTDVQSRTPNQKGIAFVNILIISVTMIVVAVPEGLYLSCHDHAVFLT